MDGIKTNYKYTGPPEHRKYNFIQSELEDFLQKLIVKLDITDHADRGIYNKINDAIELAGDLASKERGLYEQND